MTGGHGALVRAGARATSLGNARRTKPFENCWWQRDEPQNCRRKSLPHESVLQQLIIVIQDAETAAMNDYAAVSRVGPSRDGSAIAADGLRVTDQGMSEVLGWGATVIALHGHVIATTQAQPHTYEQ